MAMTTIQIKRSVLESLNSVKDHPRQTYNEVVENLLSIFKKMKKQNQYDHFLHEIQQPKMAELWGNDDDDAWEDA